MMDGWRGDFPGPGQDPEDNGWDEDEIGGELPPPPIGQDERRVQAHAHALWTDLLDGRAFPRLAEMALEKHPELAPLCVVIDLRRGKDDPLINYVGRKLAVEAGLTPPPRRLQDVPEGSVMARVGHHCRQVLESGGPVGFQNEFVNPRGATTLYRGIVLPFSEDGETISHLLGAINWKEAADPATAGELLLQIDQIMATPTPPFRVDPRPPSAPAPLPGLKADDKLDIQPPASPPARPLANWLAEARHLAGHAAQAHERSRAALYAALGLAHDFALAAAQAPAEYAALVTAAGLAITPRTPLLALARLVFGADYDKTRLAEYAATLAHAQRLGIAPGAAAAWLAGEPGGIKGVVARERLLRQSEAGGLVPVPPPGPRLATAQRLRALPPHPLADTTGEGEEFALLLVRRPGNGEVVVLGELSQDAALIEKAARRLLD